MQRKRQRSKGRYPLQSPHFKGSSGLTEGTLFHAQNRGLLHSEQFGSDPVPGGGKPHQHSRNEIGSAAGRTHTKSRSHEGVVGSFLEKARVKSALRLRASAECNFRIQLDTEAIESFRAETQGTPRRAAEKFYASARSTQRRDLTSLGRSGAAVVRECCAFPPSLLLHPPVTQHPARHAHRRTPQPS